MMTKREIVESIQSAILDVDTSGIMAGRPIQALSDRLRKSGRYVEFDEHRIHMISTFGVAWTIEQLADRLVHRAAQVGAENALDEVHNYQVANHVKLQRILLLDRINIDEAFTFSNGVRLVSARELPDSPLRESLVSQFPGLQIGWNIDAVLTADFSAKKEILLQDREQLIDRSSQSGETALTKLMDDTRLFLSLARPREYGVAVLAATTLVPTRLSFLRGGIGYDIFAEPHSSFGPEVMRFDMQCADKMLLAFEGLNEETKARMRIALKRLNDAKIERDWANKAINLRICLENIFLNPGEESQIARRIAERAPGHTSFSRTRARKVYSFLSKSVHTGQVQYHPEIDEQMIADEVQNVLRKIMQDGAYPLWSDMDHSLKSKLSSLLKWILRRLGIKSVAL